MNLSKPIIRDYVDFVIRFLRSNQFPNFSHENNLVSTPARLRRLIFGKRFLKGTPLYSINNKIREWFSLDDTRTALDSIRVESFPLDPRPPDADSRYSRERVINILITFDSFLRGRLVDQYYKTGRDFAGLNRRRPATMIGPTLREHEINIVCIVFWHLDIEQQLCLVIQ